MSSSKKLSNAHNIYHSLREEILSLTLMPGSNIDEKTIAERFEVSRSPVREAFIRLAGEGLIQTLPNKNSQVSPLEMEDFPHFIDALDLTQRAVTRLAAIHRDQQDIDAIRAANQVYKQAVKAAQIDRMIDANCKFHICIANASQNKYLIDSYQRLMNLGRRTLRLYYRSFDDKPPADRVDNHARIIEAIELQDAALADELAHQHAQQLKQGFISYLNRSYTNQIQLWICIKKPPWRRFKEDSSFYQLAMGLTSAS